MHTRMHVHKFMHTCPQKILRNDWLMPGVGLSTPLLPSLPSPLLSSACRDNQRCAFPSPDLFCPDMLMRLSSFPLPSSTPSLQWGCLLLHTNQPYPGSPGRWILKPQRFSEGLIANKELTAVKAIPGRQKGCQPSRIRNGYCPKQDAA
jgi:hypothetical protein